MTTTAMNKAIRGLAVAAMFVFLVFPAGAEKEDAPGGDFAPGTFTGPNQPKPEATRPAFVEGEVLVKFKKTAVDFSKQEQDPEAASFYRTNNVEEKTKIRSLNVALVKSPQKTTDNLVAQLRNDPNIEYAEPNFLYYADSTTPNDTSFSELWGLNNTGQTVNGTAGTSDADIDAPEAWDIQTSASGVTVAVIDTGVNLDHPDLDSNIVAGYDFVDSDSSAYDLNGHGTHVAGTIAGIGNNSRGVAGVTWGANIMPLRVLNVYGSGSNENIASAVTYAAQNGADIINMSLGGTGFSQTLYDAIDGARSAGVLAVVAAGNDGTDNDGGTHHYPCDYDLDNIICVAATNQSDGLASFSNYGTTSVDVGAPGTNIYSTYPGLALDETFEEATTETLYGYNLTGTNFTVSGDTEPEGWIVTDTGGDKWAESTYGSPFHGIDTYLTSASINTAGRSAVFLNFNYDFLTETSLTADCEYDYLELDVYNGSSWTALGRLCNYGDITDEQVGTAKVDLTSYASSGMRVRFHWHTDASVGSFPFFLNNVQIFDTRENYDYLNGTSMATPQVAGLAALIKGYSPNLTAAQIKGTILDTGDSLSALVGKTVTEKRVNALSALQDVDTRAPTRPTSYAVYSDSTRNILLRSTTTYALERPYFKWGGATDSGSGVQGYYVKLSTSSTANAASGAFQTGNSYVPSRLRTSDTYYLHVKTVDNAGNLSAGIKIPYHFRVPKAYIIAGAKRGRNDVRVYTTRGNLVASFRAYSNSRLTGVNAATGDVNGDGKLDIITAPREGGAPRVKIFNSRGTNLGKDFNAYTSAYTNGVNVAAGDVDGDGIDEIVTALMGGARPIVRIFDYRQGRFQQVYKTFVAYGRSSTGGAAVAVGDLNDDGRDEIVTALTNAGSSSVQVFKKQGSSFTPMRNALRAYPRDFTGTVLLAVGDVNENGKGDVITGVAGSGNPQVRTFKYRSGSLETLYTGFMAYQRASQGGVSVAALDYNADGKEEIVTGAGRNGNPTVKIFSGRGVQRGTAFNAFPRTYQDGITVAAGRF